MEEELEEVLIPAQNRRAKVATVGAAVVGVAAIAYFGKKAWDRYKDSRTEVVVEPVEEESEIMRDILLAKKLVDEANEVAREHGIPTTDERQAVAVQEAAEMAAQGTKESLVKTILGMSEIELDEAICRGFDKVDVTPPTIDLFADVEWDWDAAKAERTGKLVYILHEDEFFQNERDYTQDTLTYYVGDHALADQNDRPIYNVAEVLGGTFTNDFGKGTNQEDVQYVRNEYLKAEYEVVRAEQSYSEAVLGVDQTMEDYPVKKIARKTKREWDEE